MAAVEQEPLLRLRGIEKRFGAKVYALRGVDLDIHRGQVHGLLGANGAGKSTLIKILAGMHKSTAGRIEWRGAEVNWTSPKAANDMGVATVHQHVPLVPSLSVLENVFLGERNFRRDTADLRARFYALCAQVNYWINPNTLVGNLRIGQRQMVSILQALATGAELIILDEPTASLAAEERELVYRIVKHLSKVEGKAILFVSHFLDEIMDLTDRVTVLRDGKAAMRADTADLDEEAIAEAIVGRQIVALERAAHDESEAHMHRFGDVRLSLAGLSSPGKFAPLDLELRAGEVIGIAGLLGSGRSEILHAIFGADPQAEGRVSVDGIPVRRNPRAAVNAGIGLVPEDREEQGLFPNFELWGNVTLPAIGDVSRLGAFPNRGGERQRGLEAIRMLGIKAHSPDALPSELSGGNAQKVTIARWLFSDVKVLLFDEPTAGIDVGAKTDILQLVRRLAGEGTSVVVVSSEFEELLAVCDRILVIRDGEITAERQVHETNEHELFLLAGGKKTPSGTAETDATAAAARAEIRSE